MCFEKTHVWPSCTPPRQPGDLRRRKCETELPDFEKCPGSWMRLDHQRGDRDYEQQTVEHKGSCPYHGGNPFRTNEGLHGPTELTPATRATPSPVPPKVDDHLYIAGHEGQSQQPRQDQRQDQRQDPRQDPRQNRGQDQGQNEGQNQRQNQWQYQWQYQGPNQERDQGQNQGPNQGQNQGPNPTGQYHLSQNRGGNRYQPY